MDNIVNIYNLYFVHYASFPSSRYLHVFDHFAHDVASVERNGDLPYDVDKDADETVK